MGSLITVAAILILGIFSALDFDLVFINFHKIFFRNDLWQLPEGSNLLKLFPPEFFQAFANRIAYQTIIAAILIFLITSLAKNHVAKKH